MANKNTSIDGIDKLPKEELDRIKLLTDIKNAQDSELSGFEKFMKRRIVPFFLPLATLSVTILFFYINYSDSQKSKATERYNSELELVKMVWDDMKTNQEPDLKEKAKKFLIKMYRANSNTYKTDNILLGINEKQRPISIMIQMDSNLVKTIKTINTNELIKQEIHVKDIKKVTLDPVTDGKTVSVLSKKDNIITNRINVLSRGQLKIYIQYDKKEEEGKVNGFANQLKEYYVIPPIDFVENKSNYGNEIRYYRQNDKEMANELAGRLQQITGIPFKLMNINQPNIYNTIEVWFSFKNQRRAISEQPIEQITSAK
ncbi:hypothetical protein FEDK69T_28130 [Flavobacterium enshiense DK69]|uniref:Uncharacterized protein n=1 Tax=Flavobacterium enshiense DK69 TaxID=1107311 RepID=V6S7D5_9FLAO|nr:hypothetical protein [Flavobacterium enshiense]ESU20300.1 hypothetical protein FEDK69T_28130 [Flavobacterium enshiense DK69]KGO95888.1 hypothetical protein Q767_09405 [Flavobacterium enshiense DK69]